MFLTILVSYTNMYLNLIPSVVVVVFLGVVVSVSVVAASVVVVTL